MNFKDLVAKLLASENLTVVRGNSPTASFDIQSRVLTLPNWKNLKDDVETMLIAHEVGHALYTPLKYQNKLAESKLLHSWCNVIEDVRIEKAIQNKFPGLQPYFKRAYKELVDNNFFGIRGKDLTKLQFIDKANLFYKAGYNCGVKFTEKEYSYIKRIDECKTFKDVFNLANELTAYSKKIKEDEQKALEMLAKLYINSDDLEDDKQQKALADSLKLEMMDDIDGDKSAKSVGSMSNPNPITEEYEETIQDNLNKKLYERADGTGFHIIDYKKMNKYIGFEPFVSFKQVSKDIDEAIANKQKQYAETAKKFENVEGGLQYAKERMNEDQAKLITAKSNYETFIADTKKEVSYLVKEFEMRKSANNYYKTKQHKTGLIDIKKIFAYKIKDEIFKTIQILPQGKNHGMVMLMDWSGSMQSALPNVIKQTVLLTEFCKRINLPFSVLAFSNYIDDRTQKAVDIENKQTDAYKALNGAKSEHLHTNYFKIIELFSHKMTNKEYEKAAIHLFNECYEYLPYKLCSTPLNESLAYMLDFIPKFKSQNKIHKLSFITLTDGEGHEIMPKNYSNWNGLHRNKMIIKKGNQDYAFDIWSQTGTLIQLIKELDPGNITALSFNLIYDTKRQVSQALTYATSWNSNGNLRDAGEAEEIKTRRDFKEKGCSVKYGFNNYDEMYFIPMSRLKAENVSIDEAMASGKIKTNSQLAKSFTNLLKRNRSSRFLLNSFVKQVA